MTKTIYTFEYLTIDIVDNLYFYYNISSRFSSHSSNNSLIENFTIDSTTSIDNSTTLLSENSTISIDDSTTSIGSLNEDSTISIDDSTTSIGLLNENLSLTSPPPAYSLSYNSFYISSNFSNITHNTTINISENRQSIIDQQSVTNDRIHFFPSFLSNIPPPPPPPTYQEALDDDRVLFVEGRDQFGNEQVYFGMGRRGSVIRGTQNRAVSTCTTVPLRDRTKASPQDRKFQIHEKRKKKRNEQSITIKDLYFLLKIL
ncbi:hypothetical protein GLOIN_2v1814678 [Rhizophagus irregularis DAOM 181602=DAOM 197198]|nr:hypothetical protein GLOIN_2v1814678 [Rhizophagus irregularis DAOM 181602=DAOM 197198]